MNTHKDIHTHKSDMENDKSETDITVCSENKSKKSTPVCSCSGEVSGETTTLKTYLPLLISAVLLFSGLAYELIWKSTFANEYIRVIWYMAAYLPVAFPVIRASLEMLKDKDFFNEYTLMTVATLGAIAIKEYPEAVAVMLFYSFGELLQDRAVAKARGNIQSLINSRESTATVIRDNLAVEVEPENILIGEVLMVKAGEKVSLDGILQSQFGSFDASALTGESKPMYIEEDGEVLSGMVNLGAVCRVRVAKKYEDSTLSRILALVEDASSRKSKKELLIRRFAKIYTPIVFLLALFVAIVPYFIFSDYVFSEWLYRALVLLVISCPCALVVSVPLGYFGGIGAASREGILFKGANYLDALKEVNTLVMDKTGTITKGVFEVQAIKPIRQTEEELLRFAKLLEIHSTHPIAKAIVRFKPNVLPANYSVEAIEELAGLGLKAMIDGKMALAGNYKLLETYQIVCPQEVKDIAESHVLFVYNNLFIGYILVADELKPDALDFVTQLHKYGINHIEMLSGDQDSLVQLVAGELGVDHARGGLLPAQKLERIEELKRIKGNVVAFIGDGINDTPAMALSDVSIAMGKLGTDAAIETADIVLQTDRPSHLITAMQIAKRTDRVITENIIFALVVKAVIMALGIMGISGLWEAVFADVGVTLLAVLNSISILRSRR